MGWHESYLTQARSDRALMKKLRGPQVEYCHRLHYLQMVTEKLAKAMLTRAGGSTPARTTHMAFVLMLQRLKGRPEIRRQLGFRDPAVFTRYIDSLLGLARKIERLAPGQAVLKRPNPEYPWEDQAPRLVTAPAEYAFPEFDPRDARMVKIDQLIDELLCLAI